MNYYQIGLNKFEQIREKFITQGVIESDLPFLFHSNKNKIGLLLIHGSEASPCNTLELGKLLFELGYNVFGVLLAGHPNNTSSVSWLDCYQSCLDSLEVLKLLCEKVYVVGSSFGGTLTYLLGIELDQELEGIITIASPTNASRDFSRGNKWAKEVYLSIKMVENNISKLNIPVLILHSSDDKVVKVNQSLFGFDNSISSQKKLIIYDGIGHSLGFGSNTLEVSKDIHNFVKSYKEPILVRFELNDSSANNVSLAGEFNNWSAISNPMTFREGKWFTEIYLSPGNYQYKFVIDKYQWILDPSGESIFTPNGQKNSIVRVN